MATSPSDIDLTTVAGVAAYIGGVDASDQAINDLLQSLVTAASAYAANYCSRDFRKQDYAQAYNGTGTQRLMLRAAPVTAVSSVTIDNVDIPARGTTAYGYVFDDTMLYLAGCYAWFAPGWQNVAVSFTAGWVTPGQAALGSSPALTVTLPMDMQQAIIETVALKYKAQRNNIGIAARMIAGETISYSQVDIPKSAKPVFDIYSRVAVVA
jgi:hypothetical protein